MPTKGVDYKYIYSLWSDTIGWDYSQIPARSKHLIVSFRNYILHEDLSWVNFLKFIENALINYLYITQKKKDVKLMGLYYVYTAEVNKIFAEESCGYRFVGNYIAPIIDEVELSEIADALANTDSITSVKIHLKKALILLSDRENPDYSNSVKESISALEALSRLIVGKPSAVMSQALDEVEKNTKIHPVLKQGLKNLYNWSSDAPGVSHANKGEEGSENFDSAKLTLVLSSGLVNYLIAKSEEAGINLKN